MVSKAEAQVVHAKRRASERYGLTLNRQSYGTIVKMIQEGRATFVRRVSNRISLFTVEYHNVPLAVVYDSLRHKVVTFLPPD